MKQGNVNPKFLKNNDEKVARGKMTENNGVCAKKQKTNPSKSCPKSRQNPSLDIYNNIIPKKDFSVNVLYVILYIILYIILYTFL